MSLLLERHGIKAFALKPSALIAAAEADLRLRSQQQGAQRSGPRPYCFHRSHVVRASCALDLIDRAIRDRYSGVWSAKRITRIIYGDADLLAAALDEARATRGGAAAPGEAGAPPAAPEGCMGLAQSRITPAVPADLSRGRGGDAA